MRWYWWLVVWVLVAFILAPLVGAMLRRADQRRQVDEWISEAIRHLQEWYAMTPEEREEALREDRERMDQGLTPHEGDPDTLWVIHSGMTEEEMREAAQALEDAFKISGGDAPGKGEDK